MFIHPERDCIYDEADFCCDWPLYKSYPLKEQVAYYKNQGFPDNAGLMACGVIVRDMSNPKIKSIEKQWWQENIKWSYQDQLSLPYLLWKNNQSYDQIDLNLWDNHLFRIHPHNHLDR